jgi:6-pyruvoyl-tetrahydropterin synthase
VEIWAYGDLDKNGMIIDFSNIKKVVYRFDHSDLNEILECPTAENMAHSILQSLMGMGPKRIRVRVWEDRDSYAEVEWNHEGHRDI